MMRSTARIAVSAVSLLVVGAVGSGCAGARGGRLVTVAERTGGAPNLTLVAFNDCDALLHGLRSAAKAVAGPYGLPNGYATDLAVPAAGGARKAAEAADAAPNAAAGSGQAAQGPAGTGYSASNNYEAGADEPDLVKTDGRRIVAVTGGMLHVVDAESRRQTGSLDLRPAIGLKDGGPVGPAANLLLSGDHALVLFPQLTTARYLPRTTQGDRPNGQERSGGATEPDDATSVPEFGPRLLLVDLAGSPRVISTYGIDGTLVDARRSGQSARVVVSSRPRITYPPATLAGGNGRNSRESRTVEQRTAEVRAAIDAAGVGQWLPRYATTTADGARKTGTVACGSVRRPAEYSGTSMLTVLTFDLKAGSLGDGQPVGIVADGDTVYSNGNTLYVANDARWRLQSPGTTAVEPRTDLYQFDTSGTGRPKYVASGSVPGWLINQYALSEWDGNLRAATTSSTAAAQPGPVDDRAGTPEAPKSGSGNAGSTGGSAGAAAPDTTASAKARAKVPAATTESAVYVLHRDGEHLSVLGSVGGLGSGERIYAVRFVGPSGYVVTFRQTDPLYVVDLRNPRQPRVTGELKITGYSAYLHPADGGRLIGVGQQATGTGRQLGTQVSLFDVADPAAPRRLANLEIPGGRSEVESDPHAFLYWPQSSTAVVPVTTVGAVPGPVTPGAATPAPDTGAASVDPGVAARTRIAGSIDTAAVVLKIGSDGIAERGRIRHEGQAQVRRSLVIGDTLWTVSDAGLRADDLDSLANRAWLHW